MIYSKQRTALKQLVNGTHSVFILSISENKSNEIVIKFKNNSGQSQLTLIPSAHTYEFMLKLAYIVGIKDKIQVSDYINRGCDILIQDGKIIRATKFGQSHPLINTI